MQRHFTDQSIFRYFSREISQFQSTWALHIGKDKTVRPHVNMSTSCRHVNISPCLWLPFDTEAPVGIWIRDKFKLQIDRSVETLWQEYGVVAGSCFHLAQCPDMKQNSCNVLNQSEQTCSVLSQSAALSSLRHLAFACFPLLTVVARCYVAFQLGLCVVCFVLIGQVW